MKLAASLITACLAVLPASAFAQAERTWTDFQGAGTAPSIQLPKTSGVALHPTSRPAVPVQAPPAPAPSPTERTPQVRPLRSAVTPAPVQTSAYFAGMRIEGKATIVDGHTLFVSGHALRLHGIEAPALAQECKTVVGTAWPCGKKAMERLSALADGQAVSCAVEESAGEGAAVTCSVRGISDVGRIMAEEGLAVPNGYDRGRYANVAALARENRAGLWSGTFVAPWNFRKNLR